MKTIPSSLTEIDCFCSNYDGVIDEEIAERLRAGFNYAEYPAYGWHGQVWYEGDQFHCEVWRRHVHIDTVSADTAEQLKQDVCDEYGSD